MILCIVFVCFYQQASSHGSIFAALRHFRPLKVISQGQYEQNMTVWFLCYSLTITITVILTVYEILMILDGTMFFVYVGSY